MADFITLKAHTVFTGTIFVEEAAVRVIGWSLRCDLLRPMHFPSSKQLRSSLIILKTRETSSWDCLSVVV